MSAMWVGMILGALAAHVQPPVLTLGKDTQAQVEVLAVGSDGAPLPNARVSATASVGQISAAQPLGGGRYRLIFTPPRERFPQVAILGVSVDAGAVHQRQWLTVPLQASATLHFVTKPRATVTVALGAQTLGPVTADRKGKASVPALVPPGVAFATMTAVDLAGNTTTKRLDLQPRPFPQTQVWVEHRRVSWADDAPTRVEVFAIDPTGKPVAATGQLRVSAVAGQLEGPAKGASGEWVYRYHAPDRVGTGKDRLTFALGQSPLAAPVELEVRPGPPSQVGVQLEPARYVAGSGAAIRIRTTARDAKGNDLRNLAATVTSSMGTVDEEPGGSLVRVPDHFLGQRRLRVQAVSRGLTGEGTLELVAGPPRSAQLTLPQRSLRAGESLSGTLRVLDGFGNPVEHASLVILASDGTPASLQELGDGNYRMAYQPPKSDPGGEVSFQISSGGQIVGTPAEHLNVLPFASWPLSAGLLAGGHDNLKRALSWSTRLSVALGIGRTDLEVIAEADYLGYANFSDTLASSGATVDGKNMRGVAAGLGLRYSLPLTVRLSVFASALVGEDWTDSTLFFAQAPGVYSTQHAHTLFQRGAVGGTFRLGPGRALAQVEFERIPATGQLTGDLGGIGLLAGYEASF